MRVYGLDFTSSPGRRKPITCVSATLTEQALNVESLVVFECFDTFENFLVTPGPWIAAMDFPFGQPRKLARNLGWPETWEEIARMVGDMSPAEFEQVLVDYKATREKGDKHHPRDTDVRARSVTPMMLTGVPVGKMFHRGVPLLEREVERQRAAEAAAAAAAAATAAAAEAASREAERAEHARELAQSRRDLREAHAAELTR